MAKVKNKDPIAVEPAEMEAALRDILQAAKQTPMALSAAIARVRRLVEQIDGTTHEDET